MSFLQFLAQKEVIEEPIIPELSQEGEQAKGGLDEILMKGGLTLDQVLTLKSEYYGLEYRIIGDTKIPVPVHKNIPE